MTGKSHSTMAVGTAVLATSFLIKQTGDFNHIASLPLTPVFALLPDIDIDGSKYGSVRVKIMRVLVPVFIILVISLLFLTGIKFAYEEEWTNLYIYGGTVLVGVLLIMNGKNLPFVKRHTNVWTKHRGITHTLIIMVGISYLFYQLYIEIPQIYYIWLSFIYGYGTHLFGDLFNDKGEPLFYPIITDNLSFHILKYDGYMESVVVAIYTISMFILSFYIWR